MYNCFLLLMLWIVVAFPHFHPTWSQQCAYTGLHVRRVSTHDDQLQVYACFRPLYMPGMGSLTSLLLIRAYLNVMRSNKIAF